MSTVIQEPAADVVVLGLGMTGGIVAAELSIAGYNVVGIDKGPMWNYTSDFSQTKYDEWGIIVMRKFDHPLPLSTFTFRNNTDQFALPIRRYTSTQFIAMGHGVGGAAQHYSGQMGRAGPWNYEMYSETVSKYGLSFLNAADPTQDVQDWPMTYNDYDPYYVEWEKAMGLTGTNQGPLVPMSANYPLAPHPITPLGTMFQSATESLGYNPYPYVTSLASAPYVNQYGVQVNGCVYDGWCAASCNYVCETGAKANTDFRTIPAAIATGKFTMALNSYIFRFDTDSSTGNVTAVRYYDAEGNIHVQPGTVFFNGLWNFNVIRLMALSGLGNPYNPATVTGSLGRGASQNGGNGRSVTGTFSIGANAYPAGNAAGGPMAIYDFADDNIDHSSMAAPGIGGTFLSVGGYAGTGPTNISAAAAASPSNIGSTFKATQKNKYLHTTTTTALSGSGVTLPTTPGLIDLDPFYTDYYGDPLARYAYDYGPNATNVANFLAPMLQPILTKMGASNITLQPVATPGGHPSAIMIHTRGGARLGKDPSSSVFNLWQQSWTSDNLFSAGEHCNTTATNVTPGTHVIGPQIYVASEGIKKYLTSPGPLA
jgi:gluconate 2-dehydrogenase alpha chain